MARTELVPFLIGKSVNFQPGFVLTCVTINYLLSPHSAAPTAEPQDASGYAVDSESIFLQWNPPPFEHQNGIIRNYIINVTELDTGVQFQYITANTQYTLYSLHPYYTYQFVISAVTVAPGPPTLPFSIQTNQDGNFATIFPLQIIIYFH